MFRTLTVAIMIFLFLGCGGGLSTNVQDNKVLSLECQNFKFRKLEIPSQKPDGQPMESLPQGGWFGSSIQKSNTNVCHSATVQMGISKNTMWKEGCSDNVCGISMIELNFSSNGDVTFEGGAGHCWNNECWLLGNKNGLSSITNWKFDGDRFLLREYLVLNGIEYYGESILEK